MVIEAELREFFKSAIGRVFKYGEFDCGLWLADWIVVTGKPDPAAKLRGTYDSGGRFLFRIWRTLDSAGLERVPEPSIGDVGIIQIAPKHYTGAICNGRRWVMLAKGGGISALGLDMIRKSVVWKV